MSSVILFKVIKPLSEQFNSCLNNRHTGLSEVDSTFCLDMYWTWCQWRMLLSKLWYRWKWRNRSSFCKLLWFLHITDHLFPSQLLFLHLLLGDAVPPAPWSVKPSTQLEEIQHSMCFLEVKSFAGVTWGCGLLWEHKLVRHTLRWMWTWMWLRNCKKACWRHWCYT